ncbi:unnamed protein product [Caenorhabditis auriculariae]|uniref:Potassium channel domain-containing protein n=1 Tax=Caenorhabditis auriculariae TaxID=2777116 RepID=A0A8S1HXX8_9PELO|nr:unnamed protein product [Caenorhabditis auriculariae]
MGRKEGGIAAIMAGRPLVNVKSGGPHVALLLGSAIYVYLGALFFQAIESAHENAETTRIEQKFSELQRELVSRAQSVKNLGSIQQNESLSEMIELFTQRFMSDFANPIAANYYDSIFYNNGKYVPLWKMDSAILFAATSIVPVGYGYITPLTPTGRVALCIYAGVGVPMALVMLTDLGKFLCEVFFRLFKENVNLFMAVLILTLILYSVIGGLILTQLSGMSMVDGIYFSTVTIFMIGFGDIGMTIPVAYVLIFIVCGVTLVTISVDVVAASVIHHIHYMGRQVGKAKEIAEKMLQMAQKINISRGLGLGMAQLGAFARMGLLAEGDGIKGSSTMETRLSTEEIQFRKRKSTAFDPDIDFDLIDHKDDATCYLYGFGFHGNVGFADMDDQDDVFYT